MIPFPPFLGFNPYYKKAHNIPYKPYIPNASCSNPSFGTTNNSTYSANHENMKQYKNDFQNKANVSKNYYSNDYNDRKSKTKSDEKYSLNDLNNNENRIKSDERYYSNNSNKNENNNDAYDPFFSIFGIDLYFDDILILALLLFLNTEDVKDSYLYIILIMLLLN